ncbi:MAG: endonuclease Q family protein [Candidatus Nanoarchaeia archaeon]
MQLFADLHIHSRFSRACSTALNLDNLVKWAKIKGLQILGTGDFTHPGWLAELKQTLHTEQEQLFLYKDIFFLLTTEVSNIFEYQKNVKKVHHVILAPNFEVVEQINSFLSKYGNLSVDGRPTLFLSPPEMLEGLNQISSKIEVFPAHIWTPHFSLFGSNSGFDSLDDCYQDKKHKIHAIETGMSSDPAMNWRLSELDDLQILSFSDSHSFWPWRLGREATIFDLAKPSYENILTAIRSGVGLTGTVETSPAYGKYHADGHRACGVWLEPEQSEKYKNRCPKCGKPLTIGVLNRVEQLADRPRDFLPKHRPPFFTLLPLSELIASCLHTSPSSKSVFALYEKLLNAFGSEFEVLMNVPKEDLEKVSGEKLANLIIANRENKLHVRPGYDGVYGKLILDDEVENFNDAVQKNLSQKSLFDFE